MSRSAVNRFLLLYFCAVWGAVGFRVDHFPLTWAPMYSVFEPKAQFRDPLSFVLFAWVLFLSL